MRALAFAALLLLSACQTPAPAPPVAAPVAPAAPAKSYIAAAHLDASLFIGSPPAAGSLAQSADMAAVREDQALKGQPRWVQAQHDDETSVFSAFGEVLGPAFTKANAPKTAALFEVMFNDARGLTGKSKEDFGRPRPRFVDATLETCVTPEVTKSYPSGHATRGWMMALVLAEVFPEKANALLARGRDYGESRVVCAQHFPSDLTAGRLIGAAVVSAAHDNAAFRTDLDAAKAELRALIH